MRRPTITNSGPWRCEVFFESPSLSGTNFPNYTRRCPAYSTRTPCISFPATRRSSVAPNPPRPPGKPSPARSTPQYPSASPWLSKPPSNIPAALSSSQYPSSQCPDHALPVSLSPYPDHPPNIPIPPLNIPRLRPRHCGAAHTHFPKPTPSSGPDSPRPQSSPGPPQVSPLRFKSYPRPILPVLLIGFFIQKVLDRRVNTV